MRLFSLIVAVLLPQTPAPKFDIDWRPVSGERATFEVELQFPYDGVERVVRSTMTTRVATSDGLNYSVETGFVGTTFVSEDARQELPDVKGVWLGSRPMKTEDADRLGPLAIVPGLIMERRAMDDVGVGSEWELDDVKYKVTGVEKVAGLEALRIEGRHRSEEGEPETESVFWVGTGDGAVLKARINLYAAVGLPDEEPERVLALLTLERKSFAIEKPHALSGRQALGIAKLPEIMAIYKGVLTEAQRNIENYDLVAEEDDVYLFLTLTPKTMEKLRSEDYPVGPKIRVMLNRSDLGLVMVSLFKR